MRKLRAKTGERLFKAVEISIFTPENKRLRRRHVAPPKRGISGKDVDVILTKVAENIEKTWPGVEYALVELGAARFNFVPRLAATS